MAGFSDLVDPDDSPQAIAPTAQLAPTRSFAALVDAVPHEVIRKPAAPLGVSSAPAHFTLSGDPATARSQIVASNDPGLLAAFDQQFPPAVMAGSGRGLAPASAYPAGNAPASATQSPLIPGQMSQEAAAAAPIHSGPTWWQKAQGLASAATALTVAPINGAIAAVQNLATLPGDLINGRPHESPGKSYDRGMARMTYTPSDPQAQSVAEDILNNKAVQSLPALTGLPMAAPGALGALMRGTGDAGRATMESLRRGEFGGAATAAPRIEPTMGPKPRYRLQDGQPVLVPNGPPQGASISAQPIATPFSAPTLGDASLPLQQRVVEAQKAGQPVNPAVLARHVEAETLPVPVKLTEGQATMDPSLISDEMNGRGKGMAAAVPAEFYQQQGKQISQNMDVIRASAAPDVPATASMVDHGQTLVDAYKRMDEPIKADITAKYKALSDANGGNLPLNGQDFVSAADAALAKQMKGRYVPSEIAGDMDSFRQGGPMTFEDFENLRTNLAAESRKAERNGDGNAAGAVNIVRSALESLPMSNETAQIKPLADAARQAAKTRFDAIKADPAYRAAINDSVPAGDSSPLADKFFGNYVTRGARANVELMREHLADDSIAGQTIGAGTLDQLRAQLKADPTSGNFSQAGYNKGLQAIAPKIDSLLDPQTAQQARALGNTARLAQTQPRGSYVNNSNTATALLSEGAKAAAAHGTNYLFGGLPVGSVARLAGGKVIDTVRSRRAASSALAPGAGITRISEFPQ